MAIKIYEKQFSKTLQSIFTTKQRFFETFGGSLQTAYGAEYDDKFMHIKTSPKNNVIIQKYDTGENVAFGTGTGNSNRFGPRQEIKSVDTAVGYDDPIAVHAGVDRFTCNDIPEQLVAEYAASHANAWVKHLNTYMADLLNENASKTLQTDLTEDGISKLFFEARKHYINSEISDGITWAAYVNADIYNLLVEHKLTTPNKLNAGNIGEQIINKFKGFVLREVPDQYFKDNACVIFAPDNIGVIGVGINTYRVIDSADFNGVAIQGAGKTANYIPEENKIAIVKATIGA
ncbi:capsid protein [Anaerococcus sp. Marseille-Q5996]|uniref:capsid protein n=1 Tax=Anaerococcus sp. Marseille-Q5996 TaxID=2972769 RepID=UPI0021C611D3|nr:capsid protein [Anaerococcus sp. Marseille-Q5996]